MLASPIILYDYPQIAAESAGDLFDGTEIDEILALRVLTMTDDEKREARESDERARQILDRTDALTPEHWARLHGTRARTPKGDRDGPMNEWEWRLLEDRTPVDRVAAPGGDVTAGSRVRLRPRRAAAM